ncbi:hypothetical protein L6452_43382 [Arctium lappa]|uniref:Uncharacterized protein n=1 Tax=Arctium lappa TaxID=4217 RepID=A0ACB8XL80_ARCLA|nr:hypothetical protein L6452_43382 [Arctium lappa]
MGKRNIDLTDTVLNEKDKAAAGAEPKQLEFSTALGTTLGVFPIVGRPSYQNPHELSEEASMDDLLGVEKVEYSSYDDSKVDWKIEPVSGR